MHNIGPELRVRTYDAALMEIILTAAESGSAVDCIDGCLWVGVCSSRLKQKELYDNFLRKIEDSGAAMSSPVWNLLNVSTDPRLQPMFLRDLDPDSLLDIMLGEVQVLVYVDWESFFQQAGRLGICGRWTTRRERKEISRDYYHERAFRKDGRTPVMEKDGAEFMLMGGAVARIVTEGQSPLSLLETIEMNLSQLGPAQ